MKVRTSQRTLLGWVRERREAAVAPGEEVADRLCRHQSFGQEHAQHLGLEEALDVLGVKGRQGLKRSVRCPAAIAQEDMELGVEVEELPRRLEEPHGAGGDGLAVKGRQEVVPESVPSAARELSQELSVIAQEDPQPLGEGEDDLAVGDLLEQLMLSPVCPEKLPLLVAAGA